MSSLFPSFMSSAYPLHAAAAHGDLSGVQHWLGMGCSPARRMPLGLTPLHFACGAYNDACREGQMPTASRAVIELLLVLGADIHAHDACGRSPLTLLGEFAWFSGAPATVNPEELMGWPEEARREHRRDARRSRRDHRVRARQKVADRRPAA
ncbi:ankyrin repeat domain-containing protein [Bacillus sp. NP157]|nr:ankyrin repeat domain-containing protein [Bacillus sp. NP157]